MHWIFKDQRWRLATTPVRSARRSPRALVSLGVRAVVVAGSTGEAATLAEAERVLVLAPPGAVDICGYYETVAAAPETRRSAEPGDQGCAEPVRHKRLQTPREVLVRGHVRLG